MALFEVYRAYLKNGKNGMKIKNTPSYKFQQNVWKIYKLPRKVHL
jgi:hypothetical protein